MRLGKLRIEFDRTTIGRHCFIQTKLIPKGIAQIIVNLCTPWIELNGPAQYGFGLGGLADFPEREREIIMNFSRVRLCAECLAKRRDGLVEFSLPSQCQTQVAVRLCIMGLEFDCLPKRHAGIVNVPLIKKRQPQGVMNIREIWFETQCFATLRYSFFQPPQSPERHRQIGVRLHLVRCQFDCLSQYSFSFVEPAQPQKRRAQIIVDLTNDGAKIRICRQNGNGIANQLHRHVMPSHLMGQQPQQVQGIGVIRLYLENLPIQYLGVS